MNWSDLLSIDPADQGIEILNQRSSRLDFNKKEILILQDEPIQDVFLVTSGLLQAKSILADGSEVWLANLGPGAIVGEISALYSEVSSANVEIARNATVLRVAQKDFLEAMNRSGTFAVAVARMLARRIANTSSSLTSHVALKIEVRLLNALNMLATDIDGSDLRLVVDPPSISELAVRIHASREATSRAYRQLIDRGSLIKRPDGLVLKRLDQYDQPH